MRILYNIINDACVCLQKCVKGMLNVKTDTTLAEYLKYLRIKKNMTQQEVADKIGVCRSAYTYYETGKTEPNLKILSELADLFEVSLDEMIRNRKTRSEIMADNKITINRSYNRAGVLTNKEIELIECFRQLTPKERAGMLENLKKTVADSEQPYES